MGNATAPQPRVGLEVVGRLAGGTMDCGDTSPLWLHVGRVIGVRWLGRAGPRWRAEKAASCRRSPNSFCQLVTATSRTHPLNFGRASPRRRDRFGIRTIRAAPHLHQMPSHLGRVAGRDGEGDGFVVDVQPDVQRAARRRGVLRLDRSVREFIRVHVSAFLSGLSLTTNHGGSALRPTPARNPRSRKADTLTRFIASHSD